MLRILGTIGLLVTGVLAGSSNDGGCDKLAYVQFSGPVCGVIVFSQNGTAGGVTVSTLGNGIYFSDPSLGPFPYHGIYPP